MMSAPATFFNISRDIDDPRKQPRVVDAIAGATATLRTLTVAADAVVWFAVYGSNINLDDDNNITGIVDAKGLLTGYRALCEVDGKNCDKVIVFGE